MKVFVTGISSFVGRHLINLLDSRSYDLYCIVRSRQRWPNEIVWDFLSPLPSDLPRPDVIVHLAAKPYFGPRLDMEQYLVNVTATSALAQLAAKSRAKMIFSSAAIVHGDGPIVDKDSSLSPRCHYAMTKVLAERAIIQSTDNYAILRIGGIYGFNGPSHLALNQTMTDARELQKTPVLVGSGMGKRNYICVKDVARWIKSLMPDRAGPQIARSQTLYLAGPETIPIKKYIEQIARVLTPGKRPLRREGMTGKDFVVTADQAPFKLTTFMGYLESLVSQNNSHD